MNELFFAVQLLNIWLRVKISMPNFFLLTIYENNCRGQIFWKVGANGVKKYHTFNSVTASYETMHTEDANWLGYLNGDRIVGTCSQYLLQTWRRRTIYCSTNKIKTMLFIVWIQWYSNNGCLYKRDRKKYVSTYFLIHWTVCRRTRVFLKYVARNI